MPLDIGNSTLWDFTDSQLISRTGKNFLYQLPLRISTPVIFVFVSIPNRLPTWYTAGWINQFVASNVLSTNVDNLTFYKKINLGANVVSFPQSYSDYTFSIVFPNWFTQATVSVYTFTGNTGDLETIYSTVEDIYSLDQQIYTLVQNLQSS
jgi:hypothetical protein